MAESCPRRMLFVVWLVWGIKSWQYVDTRVIHTTGRLVQKPGKAPTLHNTQVKVAQSTLTLNGVLNRYTECEGTGAVTGGCFHPVISQWGVRESTSQTFTLSCLCLVGRVGGWGNLQFKHHPSTPISYWHRHTANVIFTQMYHTRSRNSLHNP